MKQNKISILKNIIFDVFKSLALSTDKLNTVFYLFKYFPDWYNYQRSKSTPLVDQKPWISFSATAFIESRISKNMIVYEYGSGGSTLFLSKRVNKVISVEHDATWCATVLQSINNHKITNCKLMLIPPVVDNNSSLDISDPDSYVSNSPQYKGMSFKSYATSINKYNNNYFDLILIDGRSRPSCFKNSVDKVKCGGYILLDNSERSYYSYVHKSMSELGWKKYEFTGFFPYQTHLSQTCIWQKPC